MSVDGTMQISYCLQEKERLFALAYGVYTNRSGVLQKGKKAESFPRLLRKSRLSAAALLAVMGLYVVLMAVQGVDALGVVVLAIAGVYAVGLVRSQKTQKRNYEYALQRFMESGETEGCCILTSGASPTWRPPAKRSSFRGRIFGNACWWVRAFCSCSARSGTPY